jgi:hypothetical protein
MAVTTDDLGVDPETEVGGVVTVEQSDHARFMEHGETHSKARTDFPIGRTS